MNELELFVVIRDTSDSAALHFMSFVAGLFAFILAPHFVGGRPSRIDLGILIGLLSAFSLISGFAAVSRLRLAGNLLKQLSTLPDAVLPALVSNFTVAPHAPTTISIASFIGCVGSVASLFEARRASGSDAEAPAA